MPNDRDALPRWMQAALHEPAAAAPDHVHRIMSVVRAAASAEARARRTRRRASRVRAFGLALAAGAAGLSIIVASARTVWRSSLSEPLEASATFIGDSIDPALHDTFDLVRFALRARGASRVVIAGDFNAWSTTATPLAPDRPPNAEQWSAVVPIRRGDGRSAFLVDDGRWVRAPRAAPPHGLAAAGHPTSHRDST